MSSIGSAIAGGVVGRNESGAIANCSNSGNISAYKVSAINGAAYAGGVTGYTSGSISSCSNSGTITHPTNLGTSAMSFYAGGWGRVYRCVQDMVSVVISRIKQG